jgi:hypothetical protein
VAIVRASGSGASGDRPAGGHTRSSGKNTVLRKLKRPVARLRVGSALAAKALTREYRERTTPRRVASPSRGSGGPDGVNSADVGAATPPVQHRYRLTGQSVAFVVAWGGSERLTRRESANNI